MQLRLPPDGSPGYSPENNSRPICGIPELFPWVRVLHDSGNPTLTDGRIKPAARNPARGFWRDQAFTKHDESQGKQYEN